MLVTRSAAKPADGLPYKPTMGCQASHDAIDCNPGARTMNTESTNKNKLPVAWNAICIVLLPEVSRLRPGT